MGLSSDFLKPPLMFESESKGDVLHNNLFVSKWNFAPPALPGFEGFKRRGSSQRALRTSATGFKYSVIKLITER